MRFKVGDKVRVRRELNPNACYGPVRFTPDMATYRGDILTIKQICLGGGYYVHENDYEWGDCLLEPVYEKNTKEDKTMSKFKVGDKVRVREGLIGAHDYNDLRCNSKMVQLVGKIITICEVDYQGRYKVAENEWTWNDDMLEAALADEIVDYKYNTETGETYIKWVDKSETRVKPEAGTKPNQYVGFVTAFAKKAAGNTSRINNLFDKWTIKKPLKDKIEKEKQAATKAEAKRIAEKRKAKREKWLLRREVLRRKRAYEAAQIAQKEYGVPVDFQEEK